MGKKLTFDDAKLKVSSKFNHLELLTFSGTTKIATFLDKEYGEFEYIYESVYYGRGNHPERSSKNRRLSFDDAEKKISDKFPHLKLLKFKKTEDLATFIDSEYGEFKAIYCLVMNGSTGHKKRSAINKSKASKNKERSNKIKETNLKKYGVENVRQVNEFDLKAKKTNLKKYGMENPAKLFSDKANKTKVAKGQIKLYDGLTIKQISKNKKYSYSSVQQFLQKGNDITKLEDKGKYNSILELNFDKNILQPLNVNYSIGYADNVKIGKFKPDFLLYDYKMIIEVDGLAVHSDLFKQNNNYHKMKKDSYLANGYTSLFFREDEINNQSHIVKSIIAAKTGNIDCRVFARKTNIIKLDSKTAEAFFTDNHLMGKGAGKCFALQYNNKIVSAIRVINRKKYTEISRFCNSLNTYVIGGLSKLLSHIIKNGYNKNIISFVDMRYGNGESLKKLGFKEKTNYISFKWTDFKKTYHRLSFKGNLGYEFGMHKIWDCGQKKFEFKVIKVLN